MILSSGSERRTIKNIDVWRHGDGANGHSIDAHAAIEAFNAHDLGRIIAFFSDNCVLEMPRGNRPWGSLFEGIGTYEKALARRFEGLPDVHYGNAEHFVDATAGTGISKWTLTGTTREGIKKEVQGCDFDHLFNL